MTNLTFPAMADAVAKIVEERQELAKARGLSPRHAPDLKTMRLAYRTPDGVEHRIEGGIVVERDGFDMLVLVPVKLDVTPGGF